MHIDWFLVVLVTFGSILSGWALWVSGRGKDEKRPADQGAEKPTSH